MTFAALFLLGVAFYMAATSRPTLSPLRYAPGFYLSPGAASAFDAACEASGETPRVTSAYRDTAKQADLYRRFLAGEPGIYAAAPPGRSLHEKGLAVDARGSARWEAAMTARGWRRPLPVSDPVHWEFRP